MSEANSPFLKLMELDGIFVKTHDQIQNENNKQSAETIKIKMARGGLNK
jgi:hypothetical protein